MSDTNGAKSILQCPLCRRWQLEYETDWQAQELSDDLNRVKTLNSYKIVYFDLRYEIENILRKHIFSCKGKLKSKEAKKVREFRLALENRAGE